MSRDRLNGRDGRGSWSRLEADSAVGIATAAPGQLDVTDQKRRNVKDGESVNKSRHTKNEASIDSEDEQVQVAK